MTFKSIDDLNRDIVSWLPRLPGGLELVVGIPRSGLLAANLVALHLNLPLTDDQGLMEGRLLSGGRRQDEIDKEGFLNRPRNVIVVDDSISSGRAMAQTRTTLRHVTPLHSIKYAAVYTSSQGKSAIDLYAQELPTYRVFEWNVMHHWLIHDFCMDIDGVLCVEPTSDENDDGTNYRQFLANAPSLYITTGKVGYLVTCRLEKYRDLTVEWLRDRNIEFGELFMLNLPDAETRRKLGIYAKFKAEIYRKTRASLFIESSYDQALEIARLTGKPVLAIDRLLMINPNLVTATMTKIRERWATKFRGTISNHILSIFAGKNRNPR